MFFATTVVDIVDTKNLFRRLFLSVYWTTYSMPFFIAAEANHKVGTREKY